MVRPVLIQYPGATDTLEVRSPAVAKRVHPGAKIIRYADSFEPYEEPKTETKQPDTPAETKKTD